MDTNQLFVGYRALGFVSDGIPFCIGYYHHKNEPYIVTSIGQAFQVYNVKQLAIISIGDTLEDKITCLKIDKKFIYAAAGTKIYAFMQLRKVCHTFKGHNALIHTMLPFSEHLISVDVDNNLKVWNISTSELFLELTFPDFYITCIIHPNFYVNKILMGSREGKLMLYNLKKNNIVYTFEGWNSPVTALQQSPALDVVGVGLKNGTIILLNLKCDEVIMKFKQDWGSITSISFRTDNHPIMVTGSEHGHISIWNLEEEKLLSQINNAHHNSVSCLHCLESQPLLVTNSSDNSLKVWIFDLPDGKARLYHIRSGHHKPPTKIRYHGDDGFTILSAGSDSTLRSFSIVHDSLNKSLGVASYNKKRAKKEGNKDLTMPPILNFASETSRQSDWDGILVCHFNEGTATTWNYNRSTMGDHKLKPPPTKDKSIGLSTQPAAHCVCITSCGNFGLVGYQNGQVHIFNLQSGLHRGSYGKSKAHDGCVIGIHVDMTNTQTITCGRDSKIKFWKFKPNEMLSEVALEFAPTISLLFRDNGNLAIGLDDYTIIIIDIATKWITRKFISHENTITDLAFTYDGRWLISSSMDCSVIVFDLLSGILVERMLMVSPVTSLCMSPTGTYMATTLVNDLGIYLWFNRSLFCSKRAIAPSNKTRKLALPSTQCIVDDDDFKDEITIDLNINEMYVSPTQILSSLTISNLPTSHWTNLINIDIIKERNKAKEPMKVPKSAPFFLPTTPGLDLAFAPLPKEEQINMNKLDRGTTTSRLNNVLHKYSQHPRQFYTITLDWMRGISVALLDLELHLIQTSQQRINFLTLLRDVIVKRTDFDFATALLNRFLKIHGEDLINDENEEICELLIDLRNGQDNFSLLNQYFSSITCLLAYNRGSII